MGIGISYHSKVSFLFIPAFEYIFCFDQLKFIGMYLRAETRIQRVLWMICTCYFLPITMLGNKSAVQVSHLWKVNTSEDSGWYWIDPKLVTYILHKPGSARALFMSAQYSYAFLDSILSFRMFILIIGKLQKVKLYPQL